MHPKTGAGRAAFARGAVFFFLWVVLIGAAPADLAAGLVIAAAATWASLGLVLPGVGRLRFAALPALVLHFLWQSVIAGWDVARRAFDPRLPLEPGFVRYATRFPRGPTRNAFASYTSLLPGTVPAQDDGEALLYHCLDVRQPVAAQLAAEETMFARAFAPDDPRR
jgi:multicomponent Na+:H+ antiporter subunit E